MLILCFIMGTLLCLELVVSFIHTRVSYGNTVPWITYLFSHFMGIPLSSMLSGFFVRILAIATAVVCLMKGIPAVF